MLIFFFVNQRNLRTVIGAPFFLNLLMHPRSRLHGIALAKTSRRVVQIPAAQNKLHQIPHGNQTIQSPISIPLRCISMWLLAI